MRKRPAPEAMATFTFPERFPGLKEIRRFAWGRVFAWEWEGAPVLIVEEWWDTTGHNTFYEYDDAAEREEDIERILRFGGGGGMAHSGVPVAVGPTPPARTGRDAKPLPAAEEPEQ